MNVLPSRRLLVLACLMLVAAVCRAGLDPHNRPPVADAGPDMKLWTLAPTVTVTLDGTASFDPDGDPIEHWWSGTGLSFPIGARQDVTLGPGRHVFTLHVANRLFQSGPLDSDSDTVVVEIVRDTTPPRVAPPDDVWVAVTGEGGARGADSQRLAAFLAGGRASDVEDPFTAALPLYDPPAPILRLDPTVNGSPVDDRTVFPVGEHLVTFRFKDRAGNIGTATARLTVFDLRDGDLFVGVRHGLPFGDHYGGVRLVRGSQVTPWCDATPPDYDPNYFEVPDEILIDSQGRVVFTARVRRPAGWALIRCNAPGQPIEKLAFVPSSDLEERPDYPSLPEALRFRSRALRGLHLARLTGVDISDALDGGAPRVVNEDSYVFMSDLLNAPSSGDLRAIRYRVERGEWEPGPEPIQGPGGGDMTNHKGDTYSVTQEAIRRDMAPLKLSLDGHLPGFDFQLDATLFGGRFDLRHGTSGAQGLVLDDTNKADRPGNCEPIPPFSGLQPDGLVQSSYSVFSGVEEVAFDEGGFELTVTSGSLAANSPYLANLSRARMDADPNNDVEDFFVHALAGCVVHQKIRYTSILPYNDPDTGYPNKVTRMVAAKQGLVGTLVETGDVVRVREGNVVEKLASVGSILGIGAWPPMIGHANEVVIVLRIDSPVDVLLTDAAGRRLGVGNGTPVNDFGAFGFDSGPGEPRLLAIKGAETGAYSVRGVGTGTGPYAIHVYAMRLSDPAGEHVLVRGEAVPGASVRHDFALTDDTRVFFVNRPPIPDPGPDQVVQATSAAGAQVSLDASGSTDPDGDALTFVWSGPFGQAAGAVIAPTLPPGRHLLTLTVFDAKGARAEDQVEVLVEQAGDTTPPVVTPPANLTVAATEAGGTRASDSPALAAFLAASAAVDDSGGATVRLAPQVAGADVLGTTLLPLGTTSVTFRHRDEAGNVGTASALLGVALGTPRIAVSLVAKSIPAPGARDVDLRFVNNGTGHARRVSLRSLLLRTLAGAGTVTLVSPTLPLDLGSLDVGESRTYRVRLGVPSTVTRLSLTEQGTLDNVAGAASAFSSGQAIVP